MCLRCMQALVISGAMLCAWPEPAYLFNCAPAPLDGQWVRVRQEDAIIVWDAANKKEHFIRRAEFESSAAEFGFLVPTPTQPELAEIDSRIFTNLESLTVPERKPRIKRVPQPPPAWRTTPGETSAAPMVEALQRMQVAGYDAAVLRADDAQALANWLQEHQYPYRAELREWIEEYTRSGWYITAFKLSQAGAAGLGPTQLNAQAVRLSFHAEQPFYPYREPADMRRAGVESHERTLRVFVVSNERMRGTLGRDETPWHARTVWANTLSAERMQIIRDLRSAQALAVPIASQWWLTEFEDLASPRPGADEVYFHAAPNAGTVARPPIYYDEIVYDPPSLVQSYTTHGPGARFVKGTWPWGVIAIVVAGIVVVGGVVAYSRIRPVKAMSSRTK